MLEAHENLFPRQDARIVGILDLEDYLFRFGVINRIAYSWKEEYASTDAAVFIPGIHGELL